MHLLALNTDLDDIKRRFFSANEQEIFTVFRHGFSFLLAASTHIFLTVILLAIGIALALFDIPFLPAPLWISLILAAMWCAIAFPALLKAFLDWKFDCIIVTTDKVIILDQSSLLHQHITPMNLENFASVTAETQFWNLFPFGTVHFQLKEGTGESFTMKFIPHAEDVAAKISDTATQFYQRHLFARSRFQPGVTSPPSPSTVPEAPPPSSTLPPQSPGF